VCGNLTGRAVRVSEWLEFGYFALLAVLSVGRPLHAARRIQALIVAAGMCVAIVWVAGRGPALVRDWAPLAFILIGYFLSGLFFVRPSDALEQWLMAWDRRVLGDPSTRFVRWPRLVLAALEIVYMGCFLLVPGGFAVLVAAGDAAHTDRYWTMIVGAEFGAFAPLAFIQTRPPWAVERPPALRDRAVHRAARRFVEVFTIRANTFPSGHAAGSVAVALAVIPTAPFAGALLLALALAICVASVVGRYHYVVDIVAGIAMAAVIFVAVMLSGL
jgi:membrane-associated phospholipid phosphatase